MGGILRNDEDEWVHAWPAGLQGIELQLCFDVLVIAHYRL